MDATLIERARSGDAAAMEALLSEIAPTVLRFGNRMCRNPHDAEDVLQDTLLAVATHLDDFEGRASFSSWAFTLARTACARKRRGLKNQPHLPEDAAPELVSEAPSAETTTANVQLGRALAAALEALPDDYREVLMLRDVEGLSAKEAADVLGIAVDALKSRLHRARNALRVALAPLLEAEAPPPAPSCPDVTTLFSRKLEGDLAAIDCAEMEKHLASCPSCAAACNAMRDVLASCKASGEEKVPPEIEARVKAAVRDFVGRWQVAKKPK